jgi:anti-sigma regulatory factor (Ser/Thr protein kinase)
VRASSIELKPELDELRRLERFIRRFCDRNGVTETVRNRTQLICEEWFVNVVKHGFGGGGEEAAGAPVPPRITVRLGMTRRGELTVRLADNGPPFNPDDLPEPDLALPAEQRPIGGLGIHLIRRLASRHRYERTDDRNVLTLFVTEGGQTNGGNQEGEEPT